MVNYWLCITNSENWHIIKEKKIWGVPYRSRGLIQKVKLGDMLVFYVSPKRITGVFRAVSKPFEDRSKIFSCKEFGREEIFPFRVRLEPVIIAKEPLDFKELVPKLRFIKNKKRWSGHLRRAMVNIPKRDYKLIFDSLKGALK